MCCYRKPTSFAFLIQLVSRSGEQLDEYVTKEYLMKICRNMIVSTETGHAELAHVSVKEYLYSRRPLELWNLDVLETLLHIFRLGFPTSFYKDVLSSQKAGGDILISLDRPMYEVLSGFKFESFTDDFRFYVYLCAYWTEHFLNSYGPPAEKMVVQMVQSESWMEYCRDMMQIKDLLGGDMRPCTASACLSPTGDALFPACVLGLKQLTKQRLDSNDISQLKNILGQSAFHAAALHGQVDISLALLEQTEIFESSDAIAALKYAAEQGLDSLADALVQRLGPDVEIDTDQRGGILKPAKAAVESGMKQTAVSIAAQNNRISTVELLLAAGAHIETQCSALSAAAGQGHYEMCALLLGKHGASLTHRDSAGRDPLLCAVSESCNPKVISLFLTHGAKADTYDHKFRTPLHTAIRKTNIEAIKLLLETDINRRLHDENGQEAILVAIRSGSAEVFSTMFPNGDSHHHLQDGQESLLHAAAKYDNISVIDILLNVPMCPSAYVHCDGQGRTPAHFAAKSKKGACVFRHLIESGWSANDRDSGQLQPVHYAAVRLNTHCIQYLDSIAVDFTSKAQNVTVIHLALLNYKVDTGFLQLLQQCGAQLDEDTDGYTTLSWALRNPVRERVIDYLLQQGLSYTDSPSGGPLHCLLSPIFDREPKHRNLIRESRILHIMDSGIDVNSTDTQGRTPLHYLLGKFCNLRSNCVAILRLLLDRGASLTQPDDYGFSALDYATQTIPAVHLPAPKPSTRTTTSPEGQVIAVTKIIPRRVESRLLDILISYLLKLHEPPDQPDLPHAEAFQDILRLRIEGISSTVQTIVEYVGFPDFVYGTEEGDKWRWLRELDRDCIEPQQQGYWNEFSMESMFDVCQSGDFTELKEMMTIGYFDPDSDDESGDPEASQYVHMLRPRQVDAAEETEAS